MSCSLADVDVASAASRIASKFSSTHSANARASRADSNTNTGARCMQSSITSS